MEDAIMFPDHLWPVVSAYSSASVYFYSKYSNNMDPD